MMLNLDCGDEMYADNMIREAFIVKFDVMCDGWFAFRPTKRGME